MANASILYGNPENSPLTSAYKGSGSGGISGGAVSGIISSFANIWGAYQQADQNQKTMDELIRELRRNKAKMQYEWKKEDAENKLAGWMSGQYTGGGTSFSGVLESNRNIVESNIAEMERVVNAQIENLRAQSRNSIIGSWIGAAGSIFGGALGI